MDLLYRAAGDITGHRTDNTSTLQRQPGVTYFGGSLLHGWLIFQFSPQNHRLIGIVLLNRDVQLRLGTGDGAGETRWRKQTLLFSATLEGDAIQDFAERLLEDPVEVSANPSTRERKKIHQWYLLTNTNTWTPDSQWLVFDVRPSGASFTGETIERVNIHTGEVEVIYRAY